MTASSHRNPLPVAVLAVPVADLGVLMIRRATPPEGLALPSGYVELGERWQDAAARELAEETGIRVDPAGVLELMVRTDEDRRLLLVFATVPPIPLAALAGFRPTAEASGLLVVDRPRPDIVFPLDAAVVARLCAARAGAGAR
jgi:ADP-ribose pyrophosphatase YjhB (NUDIX family)